MKVTFILTLDVFPHDVQDFYSEHGVASATTPSVTELLSNELHSWMNSLPYVKVADVKLAAVVHEGGYDIDAEKKSYDYFNWGI